MGLDGNCFLYVFFNKVTCLNTCYQQNYIVSKFIFLVIFQNLGYIFSVNIYQYTNSSAVIKINDETERNERGNDNNLNDYFKFTICWDILVILCFKSS